VFRVVVPAGLYIPSHYALNTGVDAAGIFSQAHGSTASLRLGHSDTAAQIA
jgi:hypothetical protein